VTVIFDMPVWVYFAAFLYPGLVFGMMRSYIDLHSAGRRANIGVISWALWGLFGHFRLKN